MSEKQLSYIDRLGIKEKSTAEIDGIKYKIEIKGPGKMSIINEQRKYIVRNIAELLMLNPIFDSEKINNKIEQVRIKDRDKIIEILNHELIGEGKPYNIVEGKIWYSYGIVGSIDANGNKTNTFYPSAVLIPADVASFKPLNTKISKDSKKCYYTYHSIRGNGTPPNTDTFEAIGDTGYGHDGVNLYCDYNHIRGADISNGINIISEYYELIRDSNNNIFYGDEKVDVKNPDELKTSCDNFFFDGINIYSISSGKFHNITKLHNLPKEVNISKEDEGTYKVGNITFLNDKSSKKIVSKKGE